MESGNTEKSVNLPEDIMEEIILRLPVKSMMRFKCVSKSWRSLISSKWFIKAHLHLQNSRKIPASAFGVVALRYDLLLQCSLPSLFDGGNYRHDPSTHHSAMKYIPPTCRGQHCNLLFNIVGCWNGLVLFSARYGIHPPKFRIFLWNPSTKICMELPKPCERERWRWVGFGWYEKDGSYKIFVVMCRGTCRVYSSETNSWKTVEHPSIDNELCKGQSMRGKHHWLMYKAKHNVIFTFDLKSEVFGTIELPFTPSRNYIYETGELGGCLCIIQRWGDVHVWVMKEYGVKESWLKLDTVSRVREMLEPPFSLRFVVASNGEMILVNGSTFLVYSPQDNEFHCPTRTYNLNGPGHLCLETLVSPLA